nr:PREDICTED: protein crumbs-like [Linepithema humile]
MASHVGDQHITVSIFKDNITVSWRLDLEDQGTVSFDKAQFDGIWTLLLIKLNNSLECGYVNPVEEQPRSSANFNYRLWHDLLVTGIVTLGGLSSALSDKHTYVTVGSKHDKRDGIEGNSVDYSEHRLTTAIPSHSVMSGEPFKGCLGEVRIGSILLHYFTNEEVSKCEFYAARVAEQRCKASATAAGKDGQRYQRVLNSCKHDGVCVNVPGSFRCECPDQFTGDLCEKFRLITCENNPCMRGATCLDSPNPKTGDNFTCNCRPGYDGPVCNSPYCTLPGQRCQNGRCEFLQTNYEYQPRCTCAPGYTGLYCETDIDECAPDLKGEVPCKNGGKCFNAVNNFTCDCQNTGYTGGNCTEDIDECENSETNCGHGRCQNLPGSYECVCDFGYCGYNCAILDFYQERERLFSSQAIDIAVIVGPIVRCFFLFIISFLKALFIMARKKRVTRSTNSPSVEVFNNSRVEMDNVLKPSLEQKLI